jgi:ABC-type tungstate transport system substrate-binding protein
MLDGDLIAPMLELVLVARETSYGIAMDPVSESLAAPESLVLASFLALHCFPTSVTAPTMIRALAATMPTIPPTIRLLLLSVLLSMPSTEEAVDFPSTSFGS